MIYLVDSQCANIGLIDSDFVHYVMEAIMTDGGILTAENKSFGSIITNYTLTL